MIVGIIWRKSLLTHASIVCEGMIAGVGEIGESRDLRDGNYSRFPNFNEADAVIAILCEDCYDITYSILLGL